MAKKPIVLTLGHAGKYNHIVFGFEGKRQTVHIFLKKGKFNALVKNLETIRKVKVVFNSRYGYNMFRWGSVIVSEDL